MGLRLTAAWAEGIGLASLSNVALLGRLRNAVPWLERIVARLLAGPRAIAMAPAAASTADPAGRATTVPRPGTSARENGRLWRIHAVYDLPSERFSAFGITTRRGKRIAGPGRAGRNPYRRPHPLPQPRRLPMSSAQGAMFSVRAGWRSARWLEGDGQACDLIGLPASDAAAAMIGRSGSVAAKPNRYGCGSSPSDAEGQAVKAVAEGRAEARSSSAKLHPDTLVAASGMLLVTRSATTTRPTRCWSSTGCAGVSDRFQRMKSLAGRQGPPGECPTVAKAWVLCI